MRSVPRETRRSMPTRSLHRPSSCTGASNTAIKDHHRSPNYRIGKVRCSSTHVASAPAAQVELPGCSLGNAEGDAERPITRQRVVLWAVLRRGDGGGAGLQRLEGHYVVAGFVF